MNFGRGVGDVPHMTYLHRFVMEQALKFHQGFLEEDPSNPLVRLEAARTHEAMGRIYLTLQKPREAEKSLNQAVRLLTEGPSPEGEGSRLHTKFLANSHLNLALLKMPQNRLGDAEGHLQQSQNLWQQLARDLSDGQAQIGLINDYIAQASLLVRRRRPREALDVCRTAWRRLDRWKAVVTGSKWQTSIAEMSAKLHLRMAGTYELILKDSAAAARHLQLAVRDLQPVVDRFPHYSRLFRDLSFALTRLGAVQLQQGSINEAESALRQALDITRKQARLFPGLPRLTQSLARGHATLGGLLLNHRKDYAAAAKELRRAADINAGLARRNPNIAVYRFERAAALVGLGESFRKLKQTDEAEPALREAIGYLKPLVEQATDDARYRHELGSAQGVLASALKHKLPASEAEQLHRDAVDHSQKAFTLSPRNPVYRRGVRNQLRALTLPLARAGKHAEVLTTLQRIADLKPPSAADMVVAAQGAASLSRVIRDDTRLSAKEQSEWAGKYSDAAMQFLQSAVARGLRNASQMEHDPLLQPLRNRPDFLRLLEKIKMSP